MQDTILFILTVANTVLCALFFICYFYQIVFILVAYLKKSKVFPDAPPHRFAILIAARNEENVIGRLVATLSEQNYPKDCYDIFVAADNCTDNTAEAARSLGATVYERHNTELIGKGYVLDFMIKSIWRERGDDAYDAFIVFDADNEVEADFLAEINKTFAAGYDVISTYRNTTNYGYGWRTAGVGLYYLRDARILNDARMKIGSNTFLTGTGFLFSNKLAREHSGWPYHTLTEDFEFTMQNAIDGVKTAYCGTARFFDWQSKEFRQSWRQRLRWTKGGFQVMIKYRKQLLRGFFSRRAFSCLDMTICIFAAFLVSMLAISVNLVGNIAYVACGGDPLVVLGEVAAMIAAAYSALLLFSIPITISEWRRLRASAFKKVIYCLTFPFYIFSFLPVAFVALFKKEVEWKPIYHGDTAKRDGEHTGQED